jgi:hypothetical protein
MKKIIISESEKFEIKKMYGLLNEQYKDGFIPSKGYQIIEDIENNMGRAKKIGGKWVPSPTPHKGNELEDVIKKYIKDENNGGLTEQEWLKIDPLFRTQIYSFMFQAGSSPGKEYRWIAGLAQAIDPSLDRGKIIGDANYRKNAYNLVKQKIKDGTINGYYDKYFSKLNEQYSSLTPNKGSTEGEIEQFKKDYEFAWKNRPKIIDEMWKGATISQMMEKYFPSDTENKPTTTSTTQTTTSTTQTKDYSEGVFTTGSVDLEKDSFNKLSKKIQDFSKRKNDIGVGEFKLFYDKNENKIKIEISDDQKGKKYSILVLAINDEAKRAQESKGYEIIKSGKIQLPNEFASSKPGGYDWYLFGNPVN